MTETRPLPLPIIQARSERCCWPVCQYNTKAIRTAIDFMAQILAGGEDVSEAIRAYLAPGGGYSLGRPENRAGAPMEAFWACYVEDIRRAWAAGCKTPEQVAKFLCPWSGMGQDDE